MLPVNSVKNISSSSDSEKSAGANNTSVPSTPKAKVPGLILATSGTPLQTAVSTVNNSPASPRPSILEWTVPKSPRLLKTKHSQRENRLEGSGAEIKSGQHSPVSLKQSITNKFEDNPPPYSEIDPYPRAPVVPKLKIVSHSDTGQSEDHPKTISPTSISSQTASPTKLATDKKKSQEIDNKTNTIDKFSEPILSPRKKAIVRQEALKRNSMEITDKSNPVFNAIAEKSRKEKMIASLAREVANSLTGEKTATLDKINTLGRTDIQFDINALPMELRSQWKNSDGKKISLTSLVRNIFFDEFKAHPSWQKAIEFINGAKEMDDPAVTIGQINAQIKEAKAMILKPLAEDVARCLIGYKGLIADIALPEQFVKNFLFPVDEKILEWAADSSAIDFRGVQVARFLSCYNLVILRFYLPLIAEQFGKNPSQMNSWMLEYIKKDLFNMFENTAADFLEKFNADMPDSLILKLERKEQAEIKEKRIAEFANRKNSLVDSPKRKNKEINWEENKIKKSNAVLLNKIKAECGIADIDSNFSDYIQSDIDARLLPGEKADRKTILLNLSFAITQYLSTNPVGKPDTIMAIQQASQMLDQLIKKEVLVEARSRASTVFKDLKFDIRTELGTYFDLTDKSGVVQKESGSEVLATPRSSTTSTTTSTLTAPSMTTTDMLNAARRPNTSVQATNTGKGVSQDKN